ncbi:MAG: hypothetical protein JXR77_16090 [Lentisphaeria bacterium]|nr:hypothetical protein [Lentisphaeria bacterium]
MRASLGGVAVLVMAVALGAGCSRPRLASRPLTEVEREWASIVRTSYPGWTPPYYAPTASPRTPALPPAPGPGALLPVAPQPEPLAVEPEGGDIELVPVDNAR